MDDSEIFEDKNLVCTECGQNFTFEAGEQYYFKEREYPDPKRCPECRAKKRAHLNPSQGVRNDQQD